MFRRVLYENWHDLVPVVAFCFTFSVFVIAFIRALLMRKETVMAMSLLPLDDTPAAPDPEKVGAIAPLHEPCQGNCSGCGCSKTS